MTADRRHYSAEERTAAVGLALSVGVKEAGRRLAIPYRTVSHWLARPDAQVAILASREDTLETLKAAAAEGAASLLSILRDPKAAHRDKVRAAEVALDRYQLMSGGPSAINANLNVNADFPITHDWTDEERDQARYALRAYAREEMARAEDGGAASSALLALSDPTAELDKEGILSLIDALERRFGNA